MNAAQKAVLEDRYERAAMKVRNEAELVEALAPSYFAAIDAAEMAREEMAELGSRLKLED